MSVSKPFSEHRYVITTAYMGFGHLRAAHNIASYGKAPILRVDQAPYTNIVDRFIWKVSQSIHTYGSRDKEKRINLLYKWFEDLMVISEDGVPPSLGASRFIRTMQRLGAGRKFLSAIGEKTPTLVHTFYMPAMLSAYHGYTGKKFLILCDTDFHRVWAPLEPRKYDLNYCVPISSSADRLISYGVKKEQIFVTGFPLPVANTGKDSFEHDFNVRKSRLKSDSALPLTIMFPFSGAGAYSKMLADLVKSLLEKLREGSLRLIVSCGNNKYALKAAENLFINYGIEELEFIEIIFHEDIFAAFDEFNQALKSTDVMITKPSELVFYAALGIPLIFLPPIGAHEERNRKYLLTNGCAVDMVSPSDFPQWIERSRRADLLLDLAENGFNKLPKNGSAAIDELARS
jgi:UDP-N-acetylglucosamine:LPS N-acetylglucosamine transferase